MPDNIPETGDVVIHSSGSPATPSFAIRAVSGTRPVRLRNPCGGGTDGAILRQALWSQPLVFREPDRLHAIGSFPRSRTSTAPANALNRWCDP